jgi:[acyl-carrier-protein] S-malonyltransferase
MLADRKIAFLFPGQGSQKVGMGADLYEKFAEAQSTFDLANETLGFDLKQICFEGPEDLLKSTEIAQPALFTSSVAALRALRTAVNIVPAAAAGHSVGEYAALVAAGSLEFSDGLRLVRKRGELMRDVSLNQNIQGGMSAILGLEADEARAVCDAVRAEGAGLVTVANYNGAGQVVISGELAAVQRAGEVARDRGAKRVIPLAVSGAFHSPLMVNAGDALFADLSQTPFRKPSVPVITNVEARYIESPADVVAGLTMQVSGSVRWEESMQLLLKDGINTVIEFGSGDVLCGLMKRIAPKGAIETRAVFDALGVEAACSLLQTQIESSPI